jgi:hypothetical protein
VKKISNVAFVLVVVGGILGSVPANADWLSDLPVRQLLTKRSLTSGSGGGGGMFGGFVQQVGKGVHNVVKAADTAGHDAGNTIVKGVNDGYKSTAHGVGDFYRTIDKANNDFHNSITVKGSNSGNGGNNSGMTYGEEGAKGNNVSQAMGETILEGLLRGPDLQYRDNGDVWESATPNHNGCIGMNCEGPFEANPANDGPGSKEEWEKLNRKEVVPDAPPAD